MTTSSAAGRPASAHGAPTADAPARPDGRRVRRAVFALAALLAIVPVLLVRRPPVLDLAPQAAQARLFLETLAGGGSAHAIAWLAPNKIAYPPLVLGWLGGGEDWGARLGLILCMVAALGGIHLLAARFGRPPESALAASVFLFSSALYGGFFNFALGGLAFALWAAELERDERAPVRARRSAPVALALGALLWVSHLLWLLAAAALTVLELAVRPAARRARRGRLAALAPFLLAAALWQVNVADPQWRTGVTYRSPPLLRAVDPDFLLPELLGGVRGALEPATLAALALWSAAALAGRRAAAPAGRASPALARIALLLAGGALVLPTSFGQTAQLATRWLPWAATCALLACPPLPLARRARLALAGALFATFVAITATIWKRAEREELAHFETALAGVPRSTLLLGLDLERHSRWFRRSPTPNLHHYAALERGARLAYNFDQLPSSLVLRRTAPEDPGWDYGRPTYLFSLRGARLRPFRHLLLHARPAAQAEFGERYPRWRRRAGGGHWLLWENPSPEDALGPRRRRSQLGSDEYASAATSRSSTEATVRPVRRSKR
jgi:hypothetical protein